MEFQEVIRRRKMCRSFTTEPIPPPLLDRLLANASRAPSAGFTQGWAFVVLEGSAQTDLFWTHATDASWRAAPDWPGLLNAPVIVVPFAGEAVYRARYAEPDKTGIPPDEQRWVVPYWVVDTSFAVMALLLTAADAGLGALFFSVDDRADDLRRVLGVPEGYAAIGAVALGWPAPGDRPSSSVRRRGWKPEAEVVHRGHWRPAPPAPPAPPA